MQFLAPWFLAGLAALAVPVLIHLINRERKTVVEFPSLMFLQRIPYKSVRRQRIRHLLLLVLRCLALALLVMAFTRPFFAKRATVLAGAGAKERVILVDRSWSMAYGDHWTKAVAAARAAMGDISGTDRATLVFFATEATAATEPTADHARVERALAAAKPGDAATRFGPAIKLAAQILEGSNLPRRDVVLISDFQRSAWTQQTDLRLPAGTHMSTVDVSEADAPDLAVTSASADRDASGGRDRITVAARLANTGAAAKDVPVTLAMAGRDAQTVHVTVPPHGSAQARFAAVTVPGGAVRGEVRIPHDKLANDDAWRFTVAADEAVKVLVVEPARARASQSLFLRRALAIGDQPTFDVEVKRADQLALGDLAGRSLVVLNEVPFPAGAVGARLRTLVEQGTGLLVAPGDAASLDWPAPWTSLAAMRFGAVTDRTRDAGGAVASIDYSHPALELFAAPRSGDLGAARIFRWRALATRTDSGVLARFDDGAPALVERAVGKGKVLVWTSSLDDYWTDLPVQPVYLPFVHQLAAYAGRWSERRAWFTAGGTLDLSRHGELTAMFQKADGTMPPLVLTAPSGSRQRIAPDSLARPIQLDEAGFHELRAIDTPVGSGRPVAVNVDPAEADLSHVDPAEVVTMLTSPGGVAATSTIGGAPDENERQRGIWPWVMVMALMVLVGETVLGNRLARQT